MSALSLTVPFQPDEAPHGFLGRTAVRNGVAVPSFCQEMGLDLTEVANGDPRALAILARLTGADVTDLRRNALVRRDDRTWVLGGEVVGWHMVRRRDARVCPLCLAADIAARRGPPETAAHCRSHWLIQQIRTCPVHAVELVSLWAEEGRAASRSEVHDFVGRLWGCRGGAGPAALPVVRTYVSGLETYLHRRLTQGASGVWADTLRFDVIATFAERLGVAALHGPDAQFEALDPTDWKAAGDVGWEVTSRGEAGLRDFASSLGRWARTDGDVGGFHGSFGKFWPFLLKVSKRPEYRDLCRAFASRLGPLRPALPPRFVPDGEEARGSGYRLSAASVEHGRSPETLRRVLYGHGLIEPGQERLTPRRVVLDRAAVADAMAGFGRRMSLLEAGRYLDAPNRQIRLLHRAGLIGGVAQERRRGVNVTVDRDDLDALVKALREGAVERQEPHAGEGTLLEAVRSARKPFVDVVRLVLDGRLGWVGWRAGAGRVSSVLVRVDEVRALLDGAAVDGHTRQEVSRILRVQYPGVVALVHDHMSTVAVRQRRSGQTYDVVTPGSLRAFQRDYVSVASLARSMGMHPHAARARLASLSVPPAFPPSRYGTPIYRVSDVPDPAAFE